MAIYYVRITGSDNNDGLTPATAWRTFGKALGAAGIASGDTVYIGAGVYREVITVAMTSATAETFIIGDIDGARTGDAGEIIFSPFLKNNETLPSTSNAFTLNGRDFLSFYNITFIGSSSASLITASTSTSTDIKFINCAFIQSSNASNNCSGIVMTIGFGVRANWLVDKCIFAFGNNGVTVTLTTGTGDDFDTSIKVQNSLFIAMTDGVTVTSSGTSNNEGGGVIVSNCTFIGTSGLRTTTTRVGGANFKFPCFINNSYISHRAGTAINAGELGAIIENNNIIVSVTPRANTLIGQQSVSDNSTAPLLHFGQELFYGQSLRPFASPTKQSPLLSHGSEAVSPVNDFLSIPSSYGNIIPLYNGTATSATESTLSDGSKNFGANDTLNGYTVRIVDGQGKGQSKTIKGNTSTTISGDGLWITTPNTTSKYVVFNGPSSTSALVSTGTNITLTDNQAKWGENFWQGAMLRITNGTAKNQNYVVSGNSPTVISGYSTMSAIPASGDQYEIFWGTLYRGIVSTGSALTMTDNSNPTWQNDTLKYYTCMITSGTASGAYTYISGNGPNVVSGFSNFSAVPQSGDGYAIYYYTGAPSGSIAPGFVPDYSLETVNSVVGYINYYDTAVRETGIVLSGANSIKLLGGATQDFKVAVSGATTVNVWSYMDASYSGVKPYMIVKDGSGIGVADNTGVLSVNTGQWGQISLSFTPTSNGVVTVRLQSNSTGIGFSYWDAFSII